MTLAELPHGTHRLRTRLRPRPPSGAGALRSGSLPRLLARHDGQPCGQVSGQSSVCLVSASSGALVALDLVDWAHLRSSTCDNSLEVPIQVRRLAEEVDGDPSRWADRLHQLVIHEHSGCIVQSAEFVVPFLVGLCRSDRPAVVRESLLLLADLTIEPFHTEVAAGNSGMYERTQSAIRAGYGTFVRLLDAADRKTRQAASDLLSRLNNDGDDVVGVVQGRTGE
ncbi:hypothetical protein [Micromonospora okii]|uniref:hypothetical protein n=1 Tax=Micromonospora okii TaxID=1182970 RepID=UPI001E61CD11|nr:hypothetical protein [Micromonospora okii]